MSYVQDGLPQGPRPPVLQTKQSAFLQGPLQGSPQSREEIFLPPRSTTLNLQPLLLAPLASTSLQLLASSPPGV